MTHITRIRRNSLFASLTHFIRLFANFFVFIGIARLYGPEEFGQFTAAHTLSGIFLLLADYGFDSLLVTEIAHRRDNAPQVIQSLFSMKLLFAAFAVVVMTVVASIETVSSATRTLMYIFSGYVFFNAVINFFFFLFRGYEEFHQEAKISFFMNTFLLVAVVTLSVFHVSLFLIAACFILSRILGILVAFSETEKKVAWEKFRFTLAGKADFLRINVFGLYGIFGTILFTLDTVLLSFMSNDLQVGMYQSAIKLASVGLLLSDILVYSVLPSLTQWHDGDRSGWLTLAGYVHRTFILVGTAISFFMIVFPSTLISLAYGPGKYDAAIPILRMFGYVVMVRYCSEAGGLILTSSHRQLRRLIVVAIATVFNVLANIIIIPRFGIQGAAVVAIITNSIVWVGYFLIGPEFRKIWLFQPVQYAPILLAVLLGFAFWGNVGPKVWITLPVSGLVILASIFYLGFTRSEREKLLSWKKA